ncbi:hypothetical protein WA026_001743 [Henosepilachna vigintioctopunctata]|uniref:Kinetochore protein NDC80 n=1 Tax=Henosepilachna vigintioctopunctata TaxID=420089 RepID=A0AAW1UUB8_9CUCU
MRNARTSSSNIPLPRFKRTLSSESLKDSQVSKPGFRRSNSYSQLSVPSHLVSRSSIRNEPSSSSKPNSYYKRSTNTPLHLASGCVKRMTATPLQSVPRSSRLASPALSLSSQKINDKKFISEQFQKTCSFLQNRLDDFDPTYLKTLTLNNFLKFVTLLFGEIDPRIKIDKEKYKETIFKYMKLYKYPGNVSISMLKSANTSLSWAPIMSMFGWLIDLINYSNAEEYQNEKLRKYIVEGSIRRFRGIETENLNTNYIDEIVGLDRYELNSILSECQQLEKEKNMKNTTSNNMRSEENTLLEEYERMKLEIEKYTDGQLEAIIKKEIDDLQNECDEKAKKIEEIKSSITTAEERISSQKYTLEDKKNLERKIEDLQFSVNLKKEKLDSIRKLKDDYDYKLTNSRRQIEVKVHEINERLLQLKPALINVDAKKIQLPDRGFHSQQFLETVEEKIQLLQNIRENVNMELNIVRNDLDNVRKEYDVLTNDVSEKEKMLAFRQQELEKIQVDISRLNFESEVLEQQLENKITTLLETAPDVESIKEQNLQLQKEVSRLLEEIKDYSNESVDLFKKFYEDAITDGAEMKNMMNHLYNKCFEAFDYCSKEMGTLSQEL